MRFGFGLHTLQLSLARQGLPGVVGGPAVPAHGPRVDVVQLAARAWTPCLVAPSVLEELMLAIAHRSRNGAVIPHWDKRQPAQNTGDGHHVGYLARLRLIQLLSPALASLPPPRRGAPAGRRFTLFICSFVGLHRVC